MIMHDLSYRYSIVIETNRSKPIVPQFFGFQGICRDYPTNGSKQNFPGLVKKA